MQSDLLNQNSRTSPVQVPHEIKISSYLMRKCRHMLNEGFKVGFVAHCQSYVVSSSYDNVCQHRWRFVSDGTKSDSTDSTRDIYRDACIHAVVVNMFPSCLSVKVPSELYLVVSELTSSGGIVDLVGNTHKIIQRHYR